MKVGLRFYRNIVDDFIRNRFYYKIFNNSYLYRHIAILNPLLHFVLYKIMTIKSIGQAVAPSF